MLTDAKFRVLVVLWSYVVKLGNDGSSSARGLATSRESATFARRPITARILDALIDFGFTDALGEDDWPRFADWHDYQPIDPTSAERLRRWRQKRYGTSYRDEGELGKVVRIELPEAS